MTSPSKNKYSVSRDTGLLRHVMDILATGLGTDDSGSPNPKDPRYEQNPRPGKVSGFNTG